MHKGGHKQVIIRVASSENQENVKNTRKSLKTLQHTATDKENLTGRPYKITLKEAIVKDTKDITDKIDLKRKKISNKSIQAGSDNKIKAEDLVSEDGPSENYWEVVAERRRIALEETLEENRLLHERIEELEEENRISKQMLEETKSLVEVLTEMVGDQEDTGIDVGDISTNDETTEVSPGTSKD